MKDAFWIFSHLGLVDHIVCCGLYRHFSEIHKKVIIPCWPHNMAALQWLLSDCKNVSFYEVETEHHLYTCMIQLENKKDYIGLGFYNQRCQLVKNTGQIEEYFNPILWDSEFYRQAGLDPELSYTGFRLPELDKLPINFIEEKWNSLIGSDKLIVYHEDLERGFKINTKLLDIRNEDRFHHPLNKKDSLLRSCFRIKTASELHLIDSSMLCLADRMETPHCKRFVFHRYARRGLPPSLKKQWEILD